MSLATIPDLTLCGIRIAIRRGDLTAVEVAQALIEQTESAEPTVQAWAHLDHSGVLAQAQALDAKQKSGASLGPLHGVPVGIKDLIDTRDFPTEYGSPIHTGRRPASDAAVIERLRRAGAIIFGKTVSTEFAFYHPGKTRNPHDSARTPGGSSSGSAAAVAAHMVPVALGTQTNGSVIRPASFCGVVGYVPTFGLIPADGTFQISTFLDRIGMFARDLPDMARLAPVLMGSEAEISVHTSGWEDLLLTAPTSPPRFGFVRTPYWERADPDTREQILTLQQSLAAQEISLPAEYTAAYEWHCQIMCKGLAENLRWEFNSRRRDLSDDILPHIERGHGIVQADYDALLARARTLRNDFDELNKEFDALLTPAATSVAPLGLGYTGDPVFCSLWSLLGVPAVSLPLLSGAAGMPLGVQLIGRRNRDLELLRAAYWLGNFDSLSAQ